MMEQAGKSSWRGLVAEIELDLWYYNYKLEDFV